MRYGPLAILICTLAGNAAAAQDVKPLVFEGRLSKDDPRDRVLRRSHHKVHEVGLEAGKCYQIDLSSKEFDTYLRLEDARKVPIAFNDDVDGTHGIVDSRLFFAPVQTARYRLIATSYEGGETGAYTLRVAALPEVGKPVEQQRTLTGKDPKELGNYHHTYPLQLKAGDVYVIDVLSKDFLPAARVTHLGAEALRNSPVRLAAAGQYRWIVEAEKDKEYRIWVTATAGKTGAYTLRLQQYRGPKAAH
jgi:hypothetical protein